MQNQISTQLTLFSDQLTSLEKTDVVEKPVVSGEPGVTSELIKFVEKHKQRLWASMRKYPLKIFQAVQPAPS
jgi:hypothetical protein